MILELGPSIGTYRNKPIPAFIVTKRDGRMSFRAIADEDKKGGFLLSKLGPDECVIAPGLIYGADANPT